MVNLIKVLRSNTDPLDSLRARNVARKKRGEKDLPLSIIPRNRKNSKLDVETKDSEVEEFWNKDNLSKKDLIRDTKTTKQKSNFLKREEDKFARKDAGKAKKERNRRTKEVSNTLKHVKEASFLMEGSFEQLERYGKAKANNLKRKEEKKKKKEEIPDSYSKYLAKREKKEEEEKLSRKAAMKAAIARAEQKSAEDDVDSLFGLSDDNLETKESVISDVEVLQDSSEEDVLIYAIADEEKTLELDVPIPVSHRLVLREAKKTNALGYTKAEVKAFSENALAKKRAKAAARKEKRAAAKAAASAHSSIENVSEAFSKRVNVTRKKIVSESYECIEDANLVTEAGEDYCVSSVIRTFLSALEPNLRSFVVFLYQIYRSSNVLDYAAAAHQYLQILNLDGIKYAMDAVNSLIDNYSSAMDSWSASDVKYNVDAFDAQDVLETNLNALDSDLANNLNTESGIIDDISSMFKTFIEGDLVIGLKNFFIAMAGMKLLGASFSTPVFKMFGNFSSKMSIIEFIDRLLESARVIVRFGSSIVSGVPLTEAVMGKDPIKDSITEIEYLIAHEEMTYTGLPVKGMISVHDYIRRLEEVVKVLTYAKKSMSPFSSDLHRVKNLLTRGELILCSKISQVQSSTRMAPFGVVIVSPPGVGKSYLLKYIAKIWSATKGREFSPEHIYPRSPTSPYWEGYNPWANPIIHYSEIARFSKAYTKTKGDNQIDELISLIDTMIFKPDMAFGDKGKVNAFPELVICDTNNATMNAECMYNAPAAYLRRFTFIEPTVLNEFKQPGSNAIDVSKSMAATNRHMLDKYSFDVYQFAPSSNTASTKIFLAQDVNLQEMTNLMANLFTEHIVNGERTNACFDKSGILGYVIPAEPVKEEAKEEKPIIRPGKLRALWNFGHRIFEKKEEVEPSFDVVEKVTEEDLSIDSKLDNIQDEHIDHLKRKAEDNAKLVEFMELRDRIKEQFDVDDDHVMDYIRAMTIDVSKVSNEDSKEDSKECQDFPGETGSCETEAGTWQRAHGIANTLLYAITLVADVLLNFVILAITWLLSNLANEGEGHWSFNPYRLFVFLFLYSNGVIPYYWFPFFVIHYSFLLTKAGYVVATQAVVVVENQSCRALGRLKQRFLGTIYNPFVNTITGSVTMARVTRILGAIAAILTTYKLASGMYQYLKPSSPIVTETDDDDIETISRSVGNVVISRVNKAVWVDKRDLMSSIRGMPCHTSGVQTLYDCISGSIRKCRVVHPSGSDGKTQIFGVKGNLALINEHAFRTSDTITLHIESSTCHVNGGGWNEMKLSKANCAKVCNDVLLFEVTCGLRFKDVVKHFSEVPVDTDVPMIVDGHKTRGFYSKTPINVRDKYLGNIRNDLPIKYDIPHAPGLCGTPIVGEFMKGSVIYGIHLAGSTSDNLCFGIFVSKSNLCKAIDSLDVLFPINSQSGFYSESGEDKVGARCLDDLVEPGFKSITRFEPLPQMEYFGKLKGPILMPKKSRLTHTKMADEVVMFFRNELGYDFELMGKPIMKPSVTFNEESMESEWRSPHNINMLKMAKNKKTLNTATLKKVRDKLFDRFISYLDKVGIGSLVPLTIEEAINGVEGDPFFRRVNASTSSGFGFKGLKFEHLPFKEGSETIREPTSELLARIEEIISLYESGKSAHPVFSGRLKDEPRSFEKIKNCRTRMFYMQSLDQLIVSRMYLAPFYTLMVKFNDIFCTAVGVDMHTQSNDMFEKLRDFSPNIFEGDYSGYDVNMPHGIGQTVNAVILKVLEYYGYSSRDLAITRGILTDNLFPYVEILQDIFCVPGLQPSGKYATAEDNSLRGLVMLMYAWEEMGFESDFFLMVLAITYGDDVVAAVKEKRFNNVSYAEFVRREFGMDFTNPNKGESTDEFVTVDTMSFLKRHFRYVDEVGKYLAYLPPDTFVKALMWTIPSRFATEETQMISTCRSMCYEFGALDMNNYNKFRNFLVAQLVDKYSIPQVEAYTKLPAKEEVVKHFLGEKMDFPPLPWEIASLSDDEFYLELDTFSESGQVERLGGVRSSSRESLIIRSAELYDTKELELEIVNHPLYPTVFKTGKPIHEAICDPRVEVPESYRQLICTYLDMRATNRVLEDRLGMANLVTESGEMSAGPAMTATISREQNFEDIMGEIESKVDAGTSQFPDIGQKTDLSLDQFFERPIEIFTEYLTTNAHTNTSFSPWVLYLSKPSVRAKLRNYAYFSADLHVRVEISGTPFHYGRVLLSYQPYSKSNSCLLALQGNMGVSTTFRPLLLNYLSQAPGAVTMDIKSNEPVEMKLPFISQKPMWRLFNSNGLVISSATEFDDSHNAGNMFVYTINLPSTTSVGASNPRYQIFAWATNVKLGTATGTQVEIVTESGDYDEREKGPIEKFSSAAMEVTAALSRIPVIAPHAKASNTLFMGLRSLASIFGFSKPVENGEPSLVKMNPFQNGANLIGMDTAKRITLDPKQELSVDPRLTGVDTDDLVISEIANRLSYLTTFTWAHSAASMVPMWRSRVTPNLATEVIHSSHLYTQPTAMAFAVQPFRYWNGRIVYRFEIVASAFHRGKIGISLEPNLFQSTLIGGSLKLNKQYMVVVDIQETQTFEICVNWQQSRYWAHSKTQATGNYGTSIDITDPYSANGMIYVYPFTTLQSNDDSDISINVYARCEDLRVNVFTDPIIRGRHRAAGGANLMTESGEMQNNRDVTWLEINKNSGSLAMCSEYHFGEEPVSFRSLLKRYMTSHTEYGVQSLDDFGELRLKDRNFPYNPYHFGVTYSQETWNLFSYLQFAYLGTKGGVRKRLKAVGIPSQGFFDQTTIHPDNFVYSNAQSLSLHAADIRPISFAGAVTFIPHNNAGVEYEIPFYCANLFAISFADDLIGNVRPDEVSTSWNKTTSINIGFTGHLADYSLEVETAAAEDFTFMRFQGAPYYTELLA